VRKVTAIVSLAAAIFTHLSGIEVTTEARGRTSAPNLSAAPAAFTLPENIPDFSQDSSRPYVPSVQSGSWSDPATWGGQVPTANSIVRILGEHVVTITDTTAASYSTIVDGKLAFATNVNTRLYVTNLEVMAGDMAMGTPGVLEVGTTAEPIAPDVTAEIVIANSPLGATVADPDQYGTGVIVFGKVSMHGSLRTPTFMRVATEPRLGATTLSFSEPATGWRVGDRIVLPDTRHIKESEVTPAGGWVNAVNQWEERTVQSISPDGLLIGLNAALQYDHLGARDLNGVLQFLPHVGNLARNVIVRSEISGGTRGHMLATHRADVDIRYTLFRHLGRTRYVPLDNTTNHIGRYPLHIHHLSGPLPVPDNGYQFTLVGNAVDGGTAATQLKWGIAVHGSHYGILQDNVVYNYNGAAIATEDGSESYNVFNHNFVLRGMGEPNDSVSEARMALGTEGVGFWFRGPNNYVTNNVAANFQNPTTEAAYGFVYQLRYVGNLALPNFQGAHTMDSTQTTVVNGNTLPILQFDNNEAYGAMQGGFTLWWVDSQDPQPSSDVRTSNIRNLAVWNIYNKAVYMYPSQAIVFDGLTILGNFTSSSRCCGNGVYFADYSSKGIVIQNSNIQGMEEGITAPSSGFGPEPNLTVRNTYLRNNVNLQVPTVGSVNGCWMTDKLVVADNVRFDAPPGRSLNAIAMVRDVAWNPECLGKLDLMKVYAFNGDTAANFQVYHPNADVLPRPPSSCSPLTRAGINGPTCPIAPLGGATTSPPTASMSASPSSITSGASATLNWATSGATTVTIDQGVGTVTASGSRTIAPSATTTYTLTAMNSAGSTAAQTTVTVTAAPPPPPPADDTTPPIVTSVAPVSGATDVSRNTTVRATFSEAMNAATITTSTFVLRNSSGNVIAATVTYDSTTRTATLRPSQSLGPRIRYTATVSGGSTGVQDVAGNAMSTARSWSFTTRRR
jgi:hypothetical protein